MDVIIVEMFKKKADSFQQLDSKIALSFGKPVLSLKFAVPNTRGAAKLRQNASNTVPIQRLFLAWDPSTTILEES
ncbi:hypothetical protein LPTSP3_g02240 [Leptospira kobayashii]|uniref:Uncharacterized protein n=1 Tax=Leptospira kobayashii TaxID=1917830 RepID=A0ABM7UFF5_9LEPT|nr:hypothetical protein LPTSP3_g02240 [Leptospira kobayashii]